MEETPRMKSVVVITGPTAVGKSQLLLELANELDAVFISADSRQVYKEMSIGTAKPSKEEIEQLDLKLVDHVSIHQPYNANVYLKEASEQISLGHTLAKVPIQSGGTGLYLKAVAEGLDYIPPVPDSITMNLEKQLETQGISSLQKELQEKDPEHLTRINIENPRRLIRALGVIRATGKTFSFYLGRKEKPEWKTINLVLMRDRATLYERINARVVEMVDQGLLAEAATVLEFKNLKALQTVGYKEAFEHLEGIISKDECISAIQQNTRRYAKRQMTWFRNQMKATYFHPDQKDEILKFIQASLK